MMITNTRPFLFFDVVCTVKRTAGESSDMPVAAPEVVTGTGLQVRSPPEVGVRDGAVGMLGRILVMHTEIIFERSSGGYFALHFKCEPGGSHAQSGVAALSLVRWPVTIEVTPVGI